MTIAILEIEEALLTRGFDGSDIAWFIANDPLVVCQDSFEGLASRMEFYLCWAVYSAMFALKVKLP
jgi:hypothetical protein